MQMSSFWVGRGQVCLKQALCYPRITSSLPCLFTAHQPLELRPLARVLSILNLGLRSPETDRSRYDPSQRGTFPRGGEGSDFLWVLPTRWLGNYLTAQLSKWLPYCKEDGVGTHRIGIPELLSLPLFPTPLSSLWVSVGVVLWAPL